MGYLIPSLVGLALLAVVPLPRRQTEVVTNSLGMKLVYIPPGQFTMGAPPKEKMRGDHEGPCNDVELTRGFYLGMYEVTQEEYQQVMDKNPSEVKGLRLPVEEVRWSDAKSFCAKLGKREGKTYRLPTEAEWEYACRAGGSETFHVGNALSSRDANFDGTTPYPPGGPRGQYRERPVEVGSFPPNAFGLHDMHGNVWEWCEDWFADDIYGRGKCEDPTGPSDGTVRVVRGGGWLSSGADCRSASRKNNAPANHNPCLGFRVAWIP